MRFRNLHLNLLAVFERLMQIHSVSAAALWMDLSRPTMSAALLRLRDYFGDPLFAIVNGGQIPGHRGGVKAGQMLA